MTADIMEKAEALAAAIAQSTELDNLKITEKAMIANEQAQQLIAKFQEEQQRLYDLQAQGEELSEQDRNAIDDMEQKVENNSLISAYLQAQSNFTQMLDSVNAILASAIASGDESGCSSCGSGCSDAGCGCEGC
ncbi:YlbF family regulator [Desulfitobacterium sp. AusDCA]|uniref:YlbF family regulator n=1 Tax=Desulfitobacterium sp. AusDCA TaxID=3240383 RepID=UPI003DA6F4FE